VIDAMRHSDLRAARYGLVHGTAGIQEILKPNGVVERRSRIRELLDSLLERHGAYDQPGLVHACPNHLISAQVERDVSVFGGPHRVFVRCSRIPSGLERVPLVHEYEPGRNPVVQVGSEHAAAAVCIINRERGAGTGRCVPVCGSPGSKNSTGCQQQRKAHENPSNPDAGRLSHDDPPSAPARL
jgi:hypothetical protein